jgi:curli production assembly/transport CsgH protein
MRPRHFPKEPADFRVGKMRGNSGFVSIGPFRPAPATVGRCLLLALLQAPLLPLGAHAGTSTETEAPKVFVMNTRTSDAAARQDEGTLHCRISRNQTGAGVQLTASIASTLAAAGSAHFSVKKSGRAGSSNIAQGKDFHVQAGQEMIVGQATISLEPGALLTAELVISSRTGAQCRAELSLEH